MESSARDSVRGQSGHPRLVFRSRGRLGHRFQHRSFVQSRFPSLDLRSAGETEQRLYGLDAWEESPYYMDRERAALAWAEAVTNIQDGHVPDPVFEQVKNFFNEKEIADLTLAITAINSWNRLSIAARTVPGTYQPAKTHSA